MFTCCSPGGATVRASFWLLFDVRPTGIAMNHRMEMVLPG
ncbi:hypothetical protein Sinac_2844 [Singulisphaera acidiphila DSM 18658]|uniref:Uncharacterized protein n=1 Tax=Singulisphaera acidiphila (strain ATCC BAA-1392 / DSM 18658 / VKM B-2454 / MOB10) TaxID=886293 RepID=L0DEP2_SINAD|nr:hypothetical protein Sinac_2844 [Singulisphaera acidiphila DSM 18658]